MGTLSESNLGWKVKEARHSEIGSAKKRYTSIALMSTTAASTAVGVPSYGGGVVENSISAFWREATLFIPR